MKLSTIIVLLVVGAPCLLCLSASILMKSAPDPVAAPTHYVTADEQAAIDKTKANAEAARLAKRDVVIANLIEVINARGWNPLFVSVAASRYSPEDVVAVVHTSWIGLRREQRLEIATVLNNLAARQYTGGGFAIWDENENKLASRKLFGGIELHGDD